MCICAAVYLCRTAEGPSDDPTYQTGTDREQYSLPLEDSRIPAQPLLCEFGFQAGDASCRWVVFGKLSRCSNDVCQGTLLLSKIIFSENCLERNWRKFHRSLRWPTCPSRPTVDGDARYSYGHLEYKNGSALKGGCHVQRFIATVQARPPAETEDPRAARKSCIGLTAQVFWIAVSEMTRAGQLGWGAETGFWRSWRDDPELCRQVAR